MLRFSFLLAIILGSFPGVAHETVKSLAEQERQQRQNIVRLQAPNEKAYIQALVSLHSELLAANKDEGYLIVDVNDEQLNRLQSLGFKSEVATEWLAQRDQQLDNNVRKANAQTTENTTENTSISTIPGFPCYATVEGTFETAQSLAEQYPQLVEMVDIGDSWEKVQGEGGYDLWVMKLTNQSIEKDKPKLFIHSAMHAREYTPAALTLDFAQDILTRYETEADAHWILNEHEIHILFHMNPDGRKRAEAGALWRKNNNHTHCPEERPGVDLNRNFTHNWNVSTDGSSGNACDNDFRGPTAGSEPETSAVEQYVRSLYSDRRGPENSDAAPDDTSGMYIDIHSFSELILWPWGHTATPTPNGEALEMLGRKIAFFNDYIPTQSIGLYPTDGTSFSIGYGELGIASIAYELGTEFFQSCHVYQTSVRPENMASLYYAAKVVVRPYQLPFGPDITDVTIVQSSVSAVTLSLRADDTRHNNSFGGNVQAQNIVEAEYYIDVPPWESDSSGIALTPADGVFDSDAELMEVNIDTTSLEMGRHIVYFRARDAQDNWGPVTAQFIDAGIEPQNAAPSPRIQTSCTDLVCELDASGSTDDGNIVSYQWLISDETELEGVSVSHTFNAAGTFEISLTLVDDAGAQATVSETVTVRAPQVDQNAAPSPVIQINCTDLACQFDASGSTDDSSIVGYQWSLSDDTQLQGMTVTHTFSAAGSYEVTLTVIDDASVEASVSQSVTVSAPPPPVAQPAPSEPVASSDSGGSLSLTFLLMLLVCWFRKVRFARN